jgi:hypothetical protein
MKMKSGMRRGLFFSATLLALGGVFDCAMTASPALATQIARHDAHCRSCEQDAGAGRHRAFGTCVERDCDAPRWSGAHATHDDWPAGMILD